MLNYCEEKRTTKDLLQSTPINRGCLNNIEARNTAHFILCHLKLETPDKFHTLFPLIFMTILNKYLYFSDNYG